MTPIVVITVQGGCVQAVHADGPLEVIIHDWDCPPDRPLVMEWLAEPLSEFPHHINPTIKEEQP